VIQKTEIDEPQKLRPLAVSAPNEDRGWITGPLIGAATLLGGLLGFWVSRLKTPSHRHSLARI
jgi:hypothetical protein